MHVTGAKRGKKRVTKWRLRFGFASDWLNRWCELFLNQSYSVAKQIQSKYGVTFGTQYKPLYADLMNVKQHLIAKK